MQVSEIRVILSCAGCYSTGAALGQYQLREEEDQLQYRGVQLRRLLQEEESYSWGDCFANYRNSYERRKRRYQETLHV